MCGRNQSEFVHSGYESKKGRGDSTDSGWSASARQRLVYMGIRRSIGGVLLKSVANRILLRISCKAMRSSWPKWSASNPVKWLLPLRIFSVKIIDMDRGGPAAASVCVVLSFGFLLLQAVPGAEGRGAQVENKTATARSIADTHPVLVELFTSEGCSSCPPADALLLKMDSSQPVRGAQLIVLSEHVDYWDHDGWKDPNSSAALTERQAAYEHALKLETPYTPQFIVDGNREMQPDNPQQVGKMFHEAAAAPKIPVSIGEVSVDTANSSILRTHIAADGSSDTNDADIYVAVALEHVESQVLHGENGGRHLTHVAVVQQLTKIGSLRKGKSFDQTVQLKIKPGTDLKNVRIVAFVQEPGPGRLLGAALRRPAS